MNNLIENKKVFLKFLNDNYLGKYTWANNDSSPRIAINKKGGLTFEALKLRWEGYKLALDCTCLTIFSEGRSYIYVDFINLEDKYYSYTYKNSLIYLGIIKVLDAFHFDAVYITDTDIHYEYNINIDLLKVCSVITENEFNTRLDTFISNIKNNFTI